MEILTLITDPLKTRQFIRLVCQTIFQSVYIVCKYISCTEKSPTSVATNQANSIRDLEEYPSSENSNHSHYLSQKAFGI